MISPNIASPQFKANAHAFYARLRAEAPVFPTIVPGKQPAWLVTRYDDVAALLKDERFAKDKLNALSPEQQGKQPWVPALFKPLTRNMLDVDAPDHTRLRQLVHKAFAPRLIDRLRERVESLTDGLIVAAERRGRMDLIADYALPIPTTIIAEMLGVPESDRHRFHRWSRVIVASAPSGWGMVRGIPAAIAFLRYIRKLVKARRSSLRDDLVSALVQAEEEGTRLNEDELVSMIFLLLIAGHETTVNLIGNGMLALLRHPDQLGRLRDAPGMIKPAVEELLRFDGPLETATERYAREPVTLAGVDDSPRRPGLRRAGVRQPGRAAVPRSRHARSFPRAESAPRLRPRGSLLPGRSARQARGADRDRRSRPPHAESSASRTTPALEARAGAPRARGSARRARRAAASGLTRIRIYGRYSCAVPPGTLPVPLASADTSTMRSCPTKRPVMVPV